jgi:hypothetical protein
LNSWGSSSMLVRRSTRDRAVTRTLFLRYGWAVQPARSPAR